MKGATMKDVVDLCSSSDEESLGPVAEQGLQIGKNVIVIDDSSDKRTTPQNQDVIEINSSSDDETPQAQESVARMPSFAADFDSSDDEQTLWISKQSVALRRKKLLSQPTTAGSEKLDARKLAKLSPRKEPSSLKDAKRQVLHLSTVDSCVKGGHNPSAAVHLSPADNGVKSGLTPSAPLHSSRVGDRAKRDLPSASIAVPKKYVRIGSNGENRPVHVDFGAGGEERHLNARSKSKLFARKTAKLLVTKNKMKKSKRGPPSPSENKLVPLSRTNGNTASRLQNSIRRFASAKASSLEDVRPQDSHWKSVLKRPSFSSRIPQSSGRGLNGFNVAAQSRKTLITDPEPRQIDGTVSPTTCDEQLIGHDQTKIDSSRAPPLSSRQLCAESEIPSSSMTVSLQSKGLLSADSSGCGSAIPPNNSGRGLNGHHIAFQSRKTPPTIPETRRIDGTVSPTTSDEQHIGEDETKVDSSQALSLSTRQPGAESESSSSGMTVSLQSKGLLSADSSGGGNAIPPKKSGHGLNGHNVAAQSRKTLPTVPETRRTDDTLSHTASDEQHLGDDETNIYSFQTISLSSRQIGAESESSSSSMIVSLENMGLLSADSSGGRSAIPPDKSSIKRRKCHSPIIDSQAGRIPPNSVVDTAASSEMMAGDAHAKPATYKEPGQFKAKESQIYEDLPPGRRRKDRAAAESNGEEEPKGEPIVARASTRKKKQMQTFSHMLDTSDDEEEGVFGVRIEHLSKYTYDSLGRPTYRFSVLGDDDTIYDLKIVVKESAIPNSGLGAHLTFLGARVLNEAVEDVEQLSTESLLVNQESLTMPLEATSPYGFGISVTLAGATLKGKTCESVLSDHSHVDGKCPKLIGGLGVYNESDFILVPKINLVSKAGFIDIGRYGPVKKTDRLPQHVADIKNFIFSDEVESYGYDVDEPIHGTRQFVDITDNATGLPHKESRRLIPSYINEVGHHPTLKRNVHIRSKEDRSIHYYLDLENPLKCGDTLELLVDYHQSYEDVRERKGYGIANIENGEKSSEHEPTALWRYFDRREFITEEIDKFSPVDVYYTLEFIVENVQEPVDAIVGEYINKGRDSIRGKPTDLQLRARRRMHWLSDVFLARISTLLDEYAIFQSIAHVPYNSLLNHSKRWAENLKWHSFAKDTQSLKNRDNNAYNTLIKASREDVLYSLSDKVVMPLKEAMWCPAAVQLIKRLAKHTALVSSLSGGDVTNLLTQKYLEDAKIAARKIRQACKDHDVSGRAPDMLKFVTEVKKDEGVDFNALISFEGFKESGFFRKHTTFRKGIIASLLEIQGYRDAMFLGCLPEQFDMAIGPDSESSTREVLIAKGFTSENGGFVEANEGLVGYPRHTDFFAKGGQINETWYLLWQVVFVVHCFVEEFISGDGGRFSFQALCEAVGVDFVSAKEVVEQGIEKKVYSINLTSKNGKVRPGRKSHTKQRSKTQTATKPRVPLVNRRLFEEIIWKTLVEELGWTLDVGNRPHDYYFLPPGVKRHCGFATRKDFFDSVTQVMAFIRTDSKWKDEPKVVEALDLFGKLTELKKNLKLKNNFDLKWLIGQLE